MKNFVITIMDNPRSVEVAERCIKSGAKYGIDIEMSPAITPDIPIDIIAKQNNILTARFSEIYSRRDNCLAAFLSHFHLWKYSYEKNEEIRIFEHDAVIMAPIPEFINYKGLMSLGKPSYGKFVYPNILGVNPLRSKQYFPGAHAYQMKPSAALKAIQKAKIAAAPTDVFFCNANFDFLEEYFPWPVEAKDSFTTIQVQQGCLAKHNYGETYDII